MLECQRLVRGLLWVGRPVGKQLKLGRRLELQRMKPEGVEEEKARHSSQI